MTRWSEADLATYQSRGAVPKSSPAKLQTPQRSKYRNRKVIDAEGIEHDSKKEYLRWLVLKERERLGVISDLHRQVVYDLCVAGALVCRYIADATYLEDGAQVVEDSKSPITRSKPEFSIKRKLMKACHGIDVRVIE